MGGKDGAGRLQPEARSRSAGILGSSSCRKFPVERVDARDKRQIVALAKKHGVDLIMNTVDPVFNEKILDVVFQYGCMHVDMAMTLSKPHPVNPYRECGVKLGDHQFERAGKWEK